MTAASRGAAGRGVPLPRDLGAGGALEPRRTAPAASCRTSSRIHCSSPRSGVGSGLSTGLASRQACAARLGAAPSRRPPRGRSSRARPATGADRRPSGPPRPLSRRARSPRSAGSSRTVPAPRRATPPQLLGPATRGSGRASELERRLPDRDSSPGRAGRPEAGPQASLRRDEDPRGASSRRPSRSGRRAAPDEPPRAEGPPDLPLPVPPRPGEAPRPEAPVPLRPPVVPPERELEGRPPVLRALLLPVPPVRGAPLRRAPPPPELELGRAGRRGGVDIGGRAYTGPFRLPTGPDRGENAKRPPPKRGPLLRNPAASYSPGESPPKYHRRSWA